FASSAQRFLPALRRLASELETLLEQLAFAPLAVISAGEKGARAATSPVAGDAGTRGSGNAAKPDPPGAGARPRGEGKRKKRGGKPPLEQTSTLKFQVYQRIQQAHQPGQDYTETIKCLKDDKDFAEQVKNAGLGKLNTKLVRNAIAFFDQRERNQARNKQD